MTQGNGTARREDDFLPEAHVLVGRRGIPIDPRDAEFVGMGSRDFDGNYVPGAGFHVLRDIERVAAKSANDFIRAGDFLSVDPDVGAVIDASKLEPDGFPLVP